MKISKPTIESYTTTDRSTKKTVKRHRVRWRAYPGAGAKPCQCKQSSFETKGRAEAFISDCLEKAKYGIDGWGLDSRGYPQRSTSATAERGTTVIDLVRSYVKTVWRDKWAPGTRTNRRGRLLVMVAMLIDDPVAATAIADGLAANAHRRKTEPTPTTQAGWVARYLRDHPLRGDDEPSDDELGPELASARSWLEDHSLPLDQLDFDMLQPLRRRLYARVSRSTRRSYWTVISACFEWAREARLMDHNPEAGLPKLKRDPDEERVDAKRVPGPSEIEAIADAVAERAGRHATRSEARERAERMARMLVITLAYCALRIGEAVALRRADVRFSEDGAAWITVCKQDSEQVASDSDDGSTTRAVTAPKGRSSMRAGDREIRLRPSIAASLRELLDTSVAPEPDARLFLTRLGRPVNKEVFRKEVWNEAIADLFPEGHRLAGITPHALRAAGMTLWLRNRVPVKIIQRWGGWKSLKVMLDTYASVLPDDLEVAAAAMDTDEPAGVAERRARIEDQIQQLTDQLRQIDTDIAG